MSWPARNEKQIQIELRWRTFQFRKKKEVF